MSAGGGVLCIIAKPGRELRSRVSYRGWWKLGPLQEAAETVKPSIPHL